MAHYFLSFPILCLFFLFPFSESVRGNAGTLGQVKCTSPATPPPPPSPDTWCIAKPSASYQELIDNMSYACNLVNCSAIQSGGPCYEPNTLISHASFAMNLYYQNAGSNEWNCDFKGSGLISVTEPSYGDCKFDCV